MSAPGTQKRTPSVRMLPEDVANKIAAGEVVERPASVVKELVENALDAGATRVTVRIEAAGRRLIEVADDGHGMSEQDALLAVERHTTSKIRTSDDLDNILTYGFRGEALASIASVSRFELVTRRARDDHATQIRVDGGILRDVQQTAAPPGTRVTAARLYFNTPVRAKFLKGVTTELSHCLDAVQRFALASPGVAFLCTHNDKVLLEVPGNATLRERVALIWGRSFADGLVELDAEREGIRFTGLIATPTLSRSSRTHQFFFLNKRPIINRSLQYGFEDGYQQLLTIGRRPVGVVMLSAAPRAVDINIHPSKREVRFRDERAARNAIRAVVRERLAALREAPAPHREAAAPATHAPEPGPWPPRADAAPTPPPPAAASRPPAQDVPAARPVPGQDEFAPDGQPVGVQTEFTGEDAGAPDAEPTPVYRPVGAVDDAPVQLFDTYLLIPGDDRLLIIDQHALHERLTYDALVAELGDRDYESQQLAVPILVDVPPSYTRLLEKNLDLFTRLGIVVEPFGGNTFQVTSICPVYDEGRVRDAVCRVLDHLAQGDLFSQEEILDDLLRLAVAACRGSVKAGDRLAPEERRALLDGFRRLRPPYTCPHGRPIILELTQHQVEKSFRRKQ